MPKSVIAQGFSTSTDVITDSISFILRKREVSPHALIKDTIMHNIAQMASISKVYIPCPFTILIK